MMNKKDEFDLMEELFGDDMLENEEKAGNDVSEEQDMNDGFPSEEPVSKENDSSKGELEVDEDKEGSLFIVTKTLRKPKLEAGNYPAQVGKLQAKKMKGDNGDWISVTIPFNIRHPKTGETVTVNFIASKSLKPKSRLYPIVCGILGAEPGENFDLRHLQGKKVSVQIDHRTTDSGDIWENVVTVKPCVI